MSNLMTEKPYLIRADLLKRGWSDSTIRRFLCEPDATKPNPFYRSAAPMRLYSRQRVEEAESTEPWLTEQNLTERRRASAAKATTTKKTQLLAQLDALQVEVPQLAMEALTKCACAHYNGRNQERAVYSNNPRNWDYAIATLQSSPEFLVRITVNYLRHCLTCYEEELERVAGRVGVKEGYAEISRRVYAAIAATYPALADECQRQLAAKLVM